MSEVGFLCEAFDRLTRVLPLVRAGLSDVDAFHLIHVSIGPVRCRRDCIIRLSRFAISPRIKVTVTIADV